MINLKFMYGKPGRSDNEVGAVVKNAKAVFVNPYFNVISVYTDDSHLSLDLEGFCGIEIEEVEDDL